MCIYIEVYVRVYLKKALFYIQIKTCFATWFIIGKGGNLIKFRFTGIDQMRSCVNKLRKADLF